MDLGEVNARLRLCKSLEPFRALRNGLGSWPSLPFRQPAFPHSLAKMRKTDPSENIFHSVSIKIQADRIVLAERKQQVNHPWQILKPAKTLAPLNRWSLRHPKLQHRKGIFVIM
jgi:hypothetical protein